MVRPHSLGCLVAVLDGDRVLLTKRQDFEVWCLPGGEVDPGEFVADAAIREAHEETGITVELIRQVGIYFRPKWNNHVVVFAARAVEGTPVPRPAEVLETRYFDAHALPTDLVWWNRQPILDAIAGVGGSSVWHQDDVWPFGPDVQNRQAVYALRDQSGLSRAEFYARHLANPGPAGERRVI